MPVIPWSAGRWTHPPVAAVERDGALHVTAAEGSDAWRLTSYGFVHDSEHALVAPFADRTAVEVEFTAAFSGQFDQAGFFVRVSAERWVKAGVEFADGRPQVGAVVTDGMSDWSLAPVPDWAGRRILVRVSRDGDALTIRAGVDGGRCSSCASSRSRPGSSRRPGRSSAPRRAPGSRSRCTPGARPRPTRPCTDPGRCMPFAA